MDKKGAIEFSMTTIMVVIIGVAVLALGLTWIRSTFTQVGTITESSLEAAETIVGEVAFSGKISAPATLQMEKNDAKKFKVLIRNTATTEDTYTLTANSAENCLTIKNPEGSVKVKANEVGDLTGGIITACGADNKDAIVTIKVSGTTAGDYATEAIAVQVR